MAGLYAIAYPDAKTAAAALETAKGLENAGYLTILEQAVVTRNSAGKIDVSEEKTPVRDAAIVGGVIGTVAGAMFVAPFVGAAIGASLGAVLGKSNTSGGNEDFKSFSDTVSKDLPNGGAAVVLLGRTDSRDRVIQNLGRHGGTVRSFDIADEQLGELQRAVDRAAGG